LCPKYEHKELVKIQSSVYFNNSFFHLSHAIAIVSQNVSTIKGKEAKNGMEAKL
jgi:hypothetical protein